MTLVPGLLSSNDPVDVIAFSGANSRAYLSAVFAAYRASNVVMALPAGLDKDTIAGCIVSSHQSFDSDTGWFEEHLLPIHTEALAQLSFSSGTTGTPKALLLPHRALSDVVQRINKAMQIDNTIREYIGVPVTFSFGFGRARAVAAAGGRAFLPEHGFDPSEIARMLNTGEINAVSAVPTLWRLVLANPDIIGVAGKKLRWIEIGSQYMAGTEKDALRQLFPNAKIVQHYGLTEASRSTLLDISETPLDRLDSIGRAYGDVEIAISAEGAIRTRGPHVAAGRLTEAGVVPVVEADGWLTTSDRGHIEDGWLYYKGRFDELINTGGLKIDPVQFEQRLTEALHTPQGIAVGRVEDSLRGERVLIALDRTVKADRAVVEAAARQILEPMGLTGRGAFEIRQVDAIPKTPTGKVQRSHLAQLQKLTLQREVPASDQHQHSNGSDVIVGFQVLWGEILGVEPDSVSIHKSFYDLGGDSLSALTAILKIEAMGIDPQVARGILDGKTISALAADANADQAPALTQTTRPALSLTEMINAVHCTRGLLAYLVVVAHWLPGVLQRTVGSYALYEMLIPFLRFGTPGFAMVFGLGIGAVRIKNYSDNPALFAKNLRFSVLLVGGGILFLALLNAGLLLSEGRFGERLTLSVMLYSVISYYGLALLTLPLLMRIITVGSNTFLTILACALVSMIIHEILYFHFNYPQMNGLLELGKVLLIAKYGFFRMTAYVLIGAAIGWYLRNNYTRPMFIKELLLVGLVLFVAGALTLYYVSPDSVLRSFDSPKPWHLAIYAGALLLIIACFLELVRARKGASFRALRWVRNFMIGSGMLALPIFVGHEMVIPAKTLLERGGVMSLVALALPLSVFIVGLGFMYRKLLKVLPY